MSNNRQNNNNSSPDVKIKILGVQGKIDGQDVTFKNKSVWISGADYSLGEEVICKKADADALVGLGQAEILK